MEHKVLFTASTYSHIRNFHLPYLRAFQERGWTVHVACGGKEEELPFTDRVIRLPLEKKMSSPRNFRAAALLRRQIEAERYELVCAHTTLASFFTRLAVRLSRHKPKVINMVHGYLFDDESSAARRELLLTAERLCAPQTDLILTMNRYDTELARRCRLAKRVEEVPGLGVDFSRFADPALPGAELRRTLGIAEDAFVLIYPAEFSKRKNQQLLIRALARLPRRAFLVLPGDGALLGACRGLAQELGVAGRVLFPGHIRGLGAWYDMADAAVSSSRSEGLPFNVMEAMHAALPVAATAVKGHVDLIEPERDGLLFPYGDEAACAEAIQRLMDTPELCARLGAAAAEDAEQYALERVFPLVMGQYLSLVEEPALVE